MGGGGYIGDPEEGAAIVAPLKQLGSPAVDLVGPMPYTAFQALIDPFAPRGMLNYHRGIHLNGLPDEAIDTYVDYGTEIAQVSSPMTQSVIFRHGGAVSRIPDDATAAGANEAEFIEADAQVHRFGDGRFDVVISRNGLMFFDDPEVGFANLARALRPGGRLAFTAPQGLDRNEWIMVVGAAAAPHTGMPEGIAPGAPGPLGLADPDRTTHILHGAGFTEVTLEDLTLPMRIGDDVEDALSFIRSIPFVRDLLAAAPAPE